MSRLNLLLLFALILGIIVTGCNTQTQELKWQINDLEYLEAPGLNILVFHNSYPVGKQGGIEIIQHGDRIATNGYITVDLPAGQSFPRPDLAERTVSSEKEEISAKVSVPEFDFDYTIRVWPENGSIHMAIDLEKSIPEEWEGRTTFDMLLYPVPYRGKTFQLGGTFGVFPFEALGPKVKRDDGELIFAPMATGSKLMIAPEDPKYKMEIEQLNGELALVDGRNGSHGGWFILQSTIKPGVTKGAVEWIIKPNAIPGWERDPMISISQVGYHSDQVKQAIIELDSRTTQFEMATLQRVNNDGIIEDIHSEMPEKWGKFLRYEYVIYDFTSFKDPGLYRVKYGNSISDPFSISPDIYKQNVWQPTLEIYFPVQMCHMRIRDRSRVWHGACHLDDALQAPVSIEHTDGYRSYAETETQYKPLTHVPGLNRGGWHDAGDNDLAAGSQASTTLYLALAAEDFGMNVDQTTVIQEEKFVELRRPDGIPDLEQQIEHGVLNLLSGYRVSGHSFAGIIATRQGRAFLGDLASLTDHLFYDASLKPDEIRGNWSGIPDDRWVFTNRDTGLEYQVASALAAASRILRGYNDALADECLETAIKAWRYEQNHEPVKKPNAYVPRNQEMHEIIATSELLFTTGNDEFKDALIGMLSKIEEQIDNAGWAVTRVWDKIDNEDFKNSVKTALEGYKNNLDKDLKENPYGVPWNPRVWGIGWSIQQYALQQYYLNQAFPEMFDRENVIRVVNYVLGCHPGSNTSLVSGVGAHSLTVAYGFNMHWWSYIPGGMASGTALVKPDLPELKEPFPFLWQQTEYVMPGAASYIFCVLAADNLLNQ
ncbi:glycoside hydrolase family 9 protein [Bacteroidota bacterium]